MTMAVTEVATLLALQRVRPKMRIASLISVIPIVAAGSQLRSMAADLPRKQG
jgi:hypothetical protein